MPKILIIYSSTDGQTKRICERIKMNSIYNSDTKIISINDASSESIIPYDNIVIGASIRYGKHNAKAKTSQFFSGLLFYLGDFSSFSEFYCICLHHASISSH